MNYFSKYRMNSVGLSTVAYEAWYPKLCLISRNSQNYNFRRVTHTKEVQLDFKGDFSMRKQVIGRWGERQASES